MVVGNFDGEVKGCFEVGFVKIGESVVGIIRFELSVEYVVKFIIVGNIGGWGSNGFVLVVVKVSYVVVEFVGEFDG